MGRSQPGHAQVLYRARNPRHCAGCAVRLARPTSTTIASAFSTRCMMLSQARRCTVVAAIGGENSNSPAGAPLKPSSVSSEAVT